MNSDNPCCKSWSCVMHDLAANLHVNVGGIMCVALHCFHIVSGLVDRIDFQYYRSFCKTHLVN